MLLTASKPTSLCIISISVASLLIVYLAKDRLRKMRRFYSRKSLPIILPSPSKSILVKDHFEDSIRWKEWYQFLKHLHEVIKIHLDTSNREEMIACSLEIHSAFGNIFVLRLTEYNERLSADRKRISMESTRRLKKINGRLEWYTNKLKEYLAKDVRVAYSKNSATSTTTLEEVFGGWTTFADTLANYINVEQSSRATGFAIVVLTNMKMIVVRLIESRLPKEEPVSESMHCSKGFVRDALTEIKPVTKIDELEVKESKSVTGVGGENVSLCEDCVKVDDIEVFDEKSIEELADMEEIVEAIVEESLEVIENGIRAEPETGSSIVNEIVNDLILEACLFTEEREEADYLRAMEATTRPSTPDSTDDEVDEEVYPETGSGAELLPTVLWSPDDVDQHLLETVNARLTEMLTTLEALGREQDDRERVRLDSPPKRVRFQGVVDDDDLPKPRITKVRHLL